MRRAASALQRGFKRVHDAIGQVLDWDILGPTLLVVCVIVAGGYWEDHRSCSRTRPTRQILRQFVGYQTIFQGALSSLDPTGGPTTTIVDPDTGEELTLTRAALRRWVQAKQRTLVDRLPIPDCSSIPAGT